MKKEIEYQKKFDSTKNLNTITGQPSHFLHKFVVYEPTQKAQLKIASNIKGPNKR